MIDVQRVDYIRVPVTDIEAAINYWRDKKPSPDGVTLAPELRALAEAGQVERLHADMAKRTIAIADAIAAMGN